MEMVHWQFRHGQLEILRDNSTAAGDTVIPEPSKVDLGHAHFLAGHDGVAHGSSLDMSKPTIHAIAISVDVSWEGAAIVQNGIPRRVLILNSDELPQRIAFMPLRRKSNGATAGKRPVAFVQPRSHLLG